MSFCCHWGGSSLSMRMSVLMYKELGVWTKPFSLFYPKRTSCVIRKGMWVLTRSHHYQWGKWCVFQVTTYVSAFLLDGASPSTTDDCGNTPLHLAAKRAFTQCAKELLKWGADAHKENDNLETPLELSLSVGLSLKDNERMADFSKFAAMIALEMRPPKYIML